MKSRSPESDAELLRKRAEERFAQYRAKHLGRKEMDPVRLNHELEVHEIELEMQNEELRAARDEIEAGLQRYTELFDFAPIGYVVLDARARILRANLEAARMIGLAREELIGQWFLVFVDPKHLRPPRVVRSKGRMGGQVSHCRSPAESRRRAHDRRAGGRRAARRLPAFGSRTRNACALPRRDRARRD